MNKVYKDGCIIIKRKSRFFYGVYGNDALIFNKYFGYKLYKQKQFATGFPVKNLDIVLEKIDSLSMNYKVVAQDKVIRENYFEENCYEILDETLQHIETVENDRNLNVYFGNRKRPNKKECIDLLKSISKNIDYYTGEHIEGLSEDSKNQIELLIEFLSPKSNTKNEIEETTNPQLKETVETIDEKVTTSTKNIVNELEVITEEIEELPEFEELNDSVIQEESLTCKNCLEYKKSECFGKPQICEDFRYSPDMDDEKRKNWPKYGDASYFRMHGHRRR